MNHQARSQSSVRFPSKDTIWPGLRIAALALVTAVGTAPPLSAQEVALENTRDVALVGVGQRTAMRVSLLHAGSDAAEVERATVYLPTNSALEGQPVLYETWLTRGGCGVVSLTFMGE